MHSAGRPYNREYLNVLNGLPNTVVHLDQPILKEVCPRPKTIEELLNDAVWLLIDADAHCSISGIVPAEESCNPHFPCSGTLQCVQLPLYDIFQAQRRFIDQWKMVFFSSGR